MIYLVSGQQEMFDNPAYARMSVEESIKEISSWGVIQLDSETTGRNARLCDFLCAVWK